MEPEFDAIVVGSGITGGWAAKELTEAGLKVLLLERGRDIPHRSGYTTEMKAPWDMPFRGTGDQQDYAARFPVQRLNRHFTEFTQNHFVDDAANPYQTGEGTAFNWYRSYNLGGRSLTWGRQSYRWSDYDFDANRRDGHGTDWPIRYADIAPWYDKVEEFIGVSGAAEGLAQLPDGRFQPAMPLNVVEQAVRERIAERWPERCLTVGRTANLTQGLPGRAPCQHRSICPRGCSFGAYFSTQSSTLPAAQATGNLTLVTDAVVEELEHDPASSRVTGVRWIDTATGTRKSARGRIVFLNAGAFNSVHLLLNSASEAMPHGLANGSGVLGTHIMDHATTLSAAALMPGFEQWTTFGNRPTGVVIARYRNMESMDGAGHSRGYSYQGGALQSAWTRGKREAGIGADYKASLRAPGPWRMVLVAFADCVPRSSNRITLHPTAVDANGLPQLKVDFAFGAEEHAALAQARADAAEMLTHAGGRVIMGFDRPGAGGSAIHEMGGARMGHDPATSVLNKWSQAHQIANLFVTDGAQMSSSACQNPSLTYMALTARAAAHAVELLREGAISMRLFGLLALALAIAAPASAQDRWITLGTSGGPQVRVERAQIANALVVAEDIYLFDAGNDVQRQLARAGLAESRIRAIVLSHHHLDHVADLGPLLITRWTFGGGPLQVIGPAGTRALVDGLIAAAAPVTLAGYPTGGPARPTLEQLVEVIELPPDLATPQIVLEAGPLRVSAVGTDHYQSPPSIPLAAMPQALAFRIETGARTIVWTGDSGVSPRLAALVAGADLLVSEVVEGEAIAAALAVQLADAPAAQRAGIMAGITRNHLTPDEIGRMAAAGQVGAVLLTHFVPSPEAVADRAIYAREIGAYYHGPVTLADDLGSY